MRNSTCGEYYPKDPNPGSLQPPITRYGYFPTGLNVAFFPGIPAIPHILYRIAKRTVLHR